jgi:outer membrane protein insertion porin family
LTLTNSVNHRRARIALLVLIVSLLAVTGLHAQQEYRVVDIEVVGNRVATPSLILGVSSIQKGMPLSPTMIEETIRRLYGLAIFSDVTIEAEQVTGGLKIYIVLKELPKLAGLHITGSEKIKPKDILEKLRLGVGGYISPSLIFEKQEEIRTMYTDKGYFQAKVTPELVYSADSAEATLTYKVEERSKVKVENVVMTGNMRVPSKELVGKMRNRHRGFLKSSDFAQDKYEDDMQKVIDEYHKKGYLDAYMISDSTSIDSVSNRMTVYVNVYEGPLYYFGKSTFKNSEELKPAMLAKTLKYKEWQVFNSDTYDKTIQEIYSAYQEIGHLHCRVDDQKTTRADSIIDVTYDITEGLPSHINLVRIVGNTKTKDKVIRRELSVLPGQTFSRTLLIRSVRDAMALNYFSNVEPAPIDLPNGDVDLEFKVAEKQTGQISAGAGYNSTDKLVGNLGLGIPNLGGNGQSLSINLERGANLNSISLSFTEPWMFGRPTLFGADLFSTNRRWYDEYTEGRQGGAARVGRRLRWPDNYFRVFASYSLERNRFNDFDPTFQASNSYKYKYVVDHKDKDTANLLVYHTLGDNDVFDRNVLIGPYPGSVLEDSTWQVASQFSFTVTRDSRNLPEFATKGSQLSYTFEHAGGILGGYWHYQKHSFTVAKFVPLFWKLALAAKAQYQFISSPDGDNRILLSDRFTPGGTNYDGIVRGFDDGSLTPDSLVRQGDTIILIRDTLKNDGLDTTIVPVTGPYSVRVRGKYMFTTNWEIQLPIAKQQFYTILFFDAGNSWLYRKDVLKKLYSGAGIGFRIVVPGIGTIGFDFARPLVVKSGQGKGWKAHFQIGTTFK